jgi:ElaB/YqjD/DUF883 family membrane-anchored ribosome-binding protein
MFRVGVEVAMDERSEAELRERIDATRSRMGETIEEIGDRVNPRRVRAEIKDTVKRKARDTMRDVEHEVRNTGRSIWDTIRENPIPAGMVGIGLAWLVANRSQSHDHHYGGGYDYDQGLYDSGRAVPYRPYYERDFSGMSHDARYSGREHSAGSYAGNVHGDNDSGHGAMDSMHDAADSMRDRAEDAVDNVRERAEHVVDNVRHAAEDAADTVRETASDVVDRAVEGIDHMQERVSEFAHTARYRAARVEQRVEYAARENPVAAGAVALAAGLMAGLLIPETRREHKLMGRANDRVMERGEEMAHRAAEKAKEIAREAGESIRDAVEDAIPDDGGSEQRPSQQRV